MDFSASQELVASNPEPRNWRANIISVLVIVFVILMVVLSVIIITPPDPGPRVKGEKIRLDDIIHGKFKPNPFNATWHSGSKLYFMNKDGGLSVFDMKSKLTKEVLDNTTFRTLNYNKWIVSGDEKHIMIVHDAINVFRYSSLAKYTVVSLEKRFSPLIKIGRIPVSNSAGGLDGQDYLQHAQFVETRDGEVGVIFVADNNIFHQPNINNSIVHQLTTSGKAGTIYNGVADWLYEEEILGQSETIYINKDGTKMAYIFFNDSGVEQHELQKFGQQDSVLRFRYPKAGTKNPDVKVYVQELNKNGNGKKVEVLPPKEISQQSDHYVCSVGWVDFGTLAVLYQNRLQNTSYYALCSHPSYQCNKIHVEKSENGWVENRGLPIFNGDLSEMVLIDPVTIGETDDSFPHIVHGIVSTRDNIPVTTLTHALTNCEVVNIVAWDFTNDWIYFISTLPDQPGVRHLVRHSVSKSDNSTPECLTCRDQQIFQNNSECVRNLECEYSEVVISPDNSGYVQHCLGPGIPSVHIFSLPDNKCSKTLDSNNHIDYKVRVSSMPKYEHLSVSLPDTSTKSRIKLTLPPVLKESEDYKFPLLVYIYGGPGTQTVSSKWSVGWDTYLASQRNFVVANIDVRGTGYQGEKFKHAVYGQLGTYEARDTIHVIHQLVERFNFIDKDKICVWGWSYGGYVTSMIMAETGPKGLISCGIAVSPVTQWHNYDTAYTERYMGLPSQQDNWKGYSGASVTSVAENIADGRLMLIHGTQDDNVHIEHTMAMSKVLVENDIIFRQQIYPDESHGLYGVTRHLYESMESFLDEIYGPIVDYFENDYYLAAAKLLEEYGDPYTSR